MRVSPRRQPYIYHETSPRPPRRLHGWKRAPAGTIAAVVVVLCGAVLGHGFANRAATTTGLLAPLNVAGGFPVGTASESRVRPETSSPTPMPVVYRAVVVDGWLQETAAMDAGRPVGPAHERVEADPMWSPDGRRIAFVSNRDGWFHLYVMNADGDDVRQITRGDFHVHAPAWSPDGTWIAFHSERDANRSQIFVAPAAGGEPRQITRGPGGGRQPAWSPDGAQLAFVRARAGVADLFVVDVTGGEPWQLMSDAGWRTDPAWSLAGDRIAFAMFLGDRWRIGVAGRSGAAACTVYEGPNARFPAWSRDGNQLSFTSWEHDNPRVLVIPMTDASICAPIGLTGGDIASP